MAMTTLKTKYANFIEFLEEIIPVANHEYIETLQSIDYFTFIVTFRAKIDEFKKDGDIVKSIVEEAYNRIIHKTQIDDSQFSDSDMMKFKRYIEYFISIADVLL